MVLIATGTDIYVNSVMEFKYADEATCDHDAVEIVPYIKKELPHDAYVIAVCMPIRTESV